MQFHLPTSRLASQAYFCGECGEVWARVQAGGQHWSCGKWSAFPASCPEHVDIWTPGLRTPGSLLQPFIWWDSLFETALRTALRTLPADWLAYEFEVHLRQAEKEAA